MKKLKLNIWRTKEKLKKLLAEGYKNTKSESLELAKEFEAVDIEGWDEY